jgi:hypothetical protein
MILNINSPVYFSAEYGVDDEVYWMGRELSGYLEDKTYGSLIDTIGICPIIAPNGIRAEDSVKGAPSIGAAAVFLHTDFEKYLNADIEGRKALIIDNVLRSVKKISKRYKIDYAAFEKDVLAFCGEHNIKLI